MKRENQIGWIAICGTFLLYPILPQYIYIFKGLNIVNFCGALTIIGVIIGGVIYKCKIPYLIFPYILYATYYSISYCAEGAWLSADLAKQIAIMSKAPLVLMPQTYGPFYTNVLKKWAIHLVKKADLAFSRDTQSAQEMHELGVENVVVATDLAFALPYYKEKYDLNSSKRKVGINVSSLLWDGGHNIKLKVNYREYCRQIIKKYSEDDKTEIHIIPHVIDENNYDSLENDSRVCKLLKEEFPCAVLAPDFKDPIEAKSYISNMDVFIGARMHSTIGAISAGVATIPFSYSKKFEGLFGNLNYPFVISATRIDTDEAVQQTVRYINDKDVLSKAYGRMMPEINDKLENVKKQIKGIMMH